MGETRIGGSFAAAIALVLVLGLVVGASVGSGAVAAPAALSAADAAPGGPILVVTATGNKFTHYLAEILQAEGLNAYATARRLGARRDAARGLRRRRPRRDAAHSRAGDGPHRLGQRRRQPDRHAARPAARRPARPHVSGGTLRKDRTSRSRRARPAPASSTRQHPVPRHGDRYTLAGATARRDPLRDSDEIDRRTRRSRCAPSAPPAARRRRSRTTSRARSSTRARATRPGPARSATASRRIRSDDLFFGAKAGEPAAGLGRPQQGRDPAGRRAAAAAGQPDHADERATASRCRASGTSRATRRPSS